MSRTKTNRLSANLAAADLAAELATNMLGLLVSGPNAPLHRIIREGLRADDGKLARELAEMLSDAHQHLARPEDDVATIVAHYIEFIMSQAVRDAQQLVGGQP